MTPSILNRRRSANRPPKPYANVLEAIGNTPLVELSRYLDVAEVTLYAKLESANPGGSAKDRPARQMIEHALRNGQIDSKSTIIESSSGNMGIGLAQACRFHGLRFVCVVDPNAQRQNLRIIEALGGHIEYVESPVGGSYLAARLRKVKELLDRVEGGFWPNQYANLQNPLSHQQGTIREIDEALEGDFDFLFVATSSTGTATGCQRYLRFKGSAAKVIAVDAEGSVLFGGAPGKRHISGLGAGQLPPLAVGKEFDDVQRVNDLDCIVGCRRAVAREAMLVGGSAGGVLEAVRRNQTQLAGATCVAILHDSGRRYLDTVYNDQWVTKITGVSASVLSHFVDHGPGGQNRACKSRASDSGQRKRLQAKNVLIGNSSGEIYPDASDQFRVGLN